MYHFLTEQTIHDTTHKDQSLVKVRVTYYILVE